MKELYWNIAVDAPIKELLTYKTQQLDLVEGDSVIVPLGKRKASGLVVGATTQTSSEFVLKEILEFQAERPRLSKIYLNWLQWLADYYMYPLGLVTELVFPPLSKKTQRQSRKSSPIPEAPRSVPPKLHPEQAAAVTNILKTSGFAPHLLFGITGSGKTEVYLHLLESILQKNQKGLVLVPEISLTPQILDRFVRRFGDQVAVIHSHLTEREKTTQWWSMVDGEKKILIGARSALFCPIENLGLIIVDEEHEPSFKQDEKLKYNARDAAVMLAKFQNCPIVLGSATPSLESWQNVQDGKYQMHQLKERRGQVELPPVKIIAMKNRDPQNQLLPSWLSDELHTRMTLHLEHKHQVALFLNRRGIAPVVFCKSCGHTRQCPNCDINLTLHFNEHLVCHYCDYHENKASSCPDCKEGALEPLGLGTEKIEEDLKRLFPEARIRRADRDEIQNRLDLEEMIQDMEQNKIDILIGTQMIAKGLDFPQLKLVGLLLADIGFNIPDFRATERSFQLLTQMSGRSGRHHQEGDLPGEVIIQAYNTEHESLLFAQKHDYENFAQSELLHRRALHYPPFSKLAALKIQSPDQNLSKEGAHLLAERAQQLQSQYNIYQSLEILGPAEAPLAKLRNQFRYHLLIKSPRAAILNQFIRQILGDQTWLPQKVRILADIDPLHLL